MLRWALIFLIIALVAALFGFTGVAAAAAGIVKFLFFLFLVICLIFFCYGHIGRQKSEPPVPIASGRSATQKNCSCMVNELGLQLRCV